MNDKIYELDEIKKVAVPILKSYGIPRASIFGSYAKNKANSDSDIDLLLEFDSTFALKKYNALLDELESKLEKKVDVVDIESIHPVLKKSILKDRIGLYE